MHTNLDLTIAFKAIHLNEYSLLSTWIRWNFRFVRKYQGILLYSKWTLCIIKLKINFRSLIQCLCWIRGWNQIEVQIHSFQLNSTIFILYAECLITSNRINIHKNNYKNTKWRTNYRIIWYLFNTYIQAIAKKFSAAKSVCSWMQKCHSYVFLPINSMKNHCPIYDYSWILASETRWALLSDANSWLSSQFSILMVE